MKTVLAVVAVVALLTTASASVLSYLEEREQSRSAERVECLTLAGLAYERPSKDAGFKWWEDGESPTGIDTLVAAARKRAREAEDCRSR